MTNGLPVLNARVSCPAYSTEPWNLSVPGLVKTLDAAKAQPVKLRRERILIDANLADGRLGRQLATGKAVDVDLAAVGTGRGAGQRRELGGEFVRVVRERIEVRALNHRCAGIAVGVDAELRRVGGHLNHLVLGLDRHLCIDRQSRPAATRTPILTKEAKPSMVTVIE